MMGTTPTPPLKWHGGKHYLATRIVGLMPSHTHYVEPFAGGLAVLLAKDPQWVSEVVNDLHGDLTTFWRVLASVPQFESFRRRMEATPFSEHEWQTASANIRGAPGGTVDAVQRACHFLVHCRQSLAGRMDDFATLSRNRTRRGMNEQASAWLTAVEGLPAVHERLKRVVILNKDARDVIRQQDGPKTLFYLDPPYLRETRTAPDVYAHEMTAMQHQRLLGLLRTVRGKFLLSGYPSKLYESYERACGWRRHQFDLPNNSAGGGAKRRMTECVWANFDLAETDG